MAKSLRGITRRGLIRKLRFARSTELDRVGLFELGSVGERVRLSGWVNFGSEPFLIHLGNDVTISDGAAFVTHDGGVRVGRHVHPDLHVYGAITVGDRAFIGMRSVVLPGVNIGSDVVVGAGSVVTRDIPSGVVAAGVPCRPLRKTEDYLADAVEKGMAWQVGRYDADWRRAVELHVGRVGHPNG
jgi:acetyltransferase-like isoleucine patch superfamily enzyme